MDKKSDTPMLAAGAAPGPSPSSSSPGPVAPPRVPRRDRPGRARPATSRAAPPVPAEDDGWDEFREPLQEAIFRTGYNEDGELEVRILPPTLYNLTHPREEDVVTQSNRHYRTLDPVDDILRRKLERRQPGTGVFSDLLIEWADPTLEDSSPDIFVVEGLGRPPEEIEGSFNVAREGASPCLIFEVVSATYKSTRDKDYKWNVGHYAEAGVEELVLVEPVTRGSPAIRKLTAYRLGAGGTYQEIAPDAKGRILLATVDMTLHVEEAAVVVADARTGERFLTSSEEEDARKAAEQRAEAAARREAEREAAAEVAARQAAEREAAAEATAHRETQRQVAQALAEALLTLLEDRALPLPDAARRRILECRDPGELRRWLRRGLRADSVDQLWDPA